MNKLNKLLSFKNWKKSKFKHNKQHDEYLNKETLKGNIYLQFPAPLNSLHFVWIIASDCIISMKHKSNIQYQLAATPMDIAASHRRHFHYYS